MASESLAAVLEREHREIDEVIERIVGTDAFTAAEREPLIRAMRLLRRHIYAEEELLFPSLREAGMFGPIMVMLREHAQMWVTLDALQHRLDTAADDAVPVSCGKLLAQLQAHNGKEEAILYPQADVVLDSDALSRLRAFLDGGELPSGWICQHLQV